jgi:hypothetical protein
MKKMDSTTSFPWKLPPGCVDVTAEAIALGTIVRLVPAPQGAQPSDAPDAPGTTVRDLGNEATAPPDAKD